MGLFAIFFSIVIVIIQATSLLLQRNAHQWTFSLVKNEPNLSHINQLNSFIRLNNYSFVKLLTNQNNQNVELEANVVSYNIFKEKLDTFMENGSNMNTSNLKNFTNELVACIALHWKNELQVSYKVPTHCFLNTHFNQKIEPILKPFNPHIILFVFCCIHAVFCISKIKTITSKYDLFSKLKNDENSHMNNNSDFQAPFYVSSTYSFALFLILIVVVFILQGIENSELTEYTTILVSVVFVALSFVYVLSHNQHKDDHEWTNSFHLHLTAVPICTLVVATLGSRLWYDTVFHYVLLLSAVNILWLENHLKSEVSKRICNIFAIFLPIFSLYTAYVQWGRYDNWKYSIAAMAYVCFAPFLIHPIVSSGKKGAEDIKSKSFGKMTMFFTSAALVSLVINFAMFETK